jgi:DNA-binding response OmpR family regulator
MSARLNIAVVENQDASREAIVHAAQQAGHYVMVAECAESLDDLLINHTFDLFVVEANLPGEDGFSIVKRMRHAYPEIFIMMMTSRDAEKERIAAYENGADLILPNTASLAEMQASIASFSRRKQLQAETNSEHLRLDLKRLVLTGHCDVSLGKSEMLILKGFVEAPNHRLAHWRLLELMGKEVNQRNHGTLQVAMLRIRKKLRAAGANGDAIKALSGQGYQLAYPVKLT